MFLTMAEYMAVVYREEGGGCMGIHMNWTLGSGYENSLKAKSTDADCGGFDNQ